MVIISVEGEEIRVLLMIHHLQGMKVRECKKKSCSNGIVTREWEGKLEERKNVTETPKVKSVF